MLWKSILGMVKPELLPEQLGRYPYLPIWGTPLNPTSAFFLLTIIIGGAGREREENPNGIWYLTCIFTFPKTVAVIAPPTFLGFRNNVECKMKNKFVH